MARAAMKPDGVPRKRGWGEGHIQFKNGAWEIRIRPYRGAGQQVHRRPRKTLAEVEAELDLMNAQKLAGVDVSRPRKPPPMTVQGLWEHYERHLQRRLAAGSIEPARLHDVRIIVTRHVLPAFGADTVDSVNSEKLLGYVAAKRTGLAPVAGQAHAKLTPRTIRHHVGVIGQMFRWAAHPERRYAGYDPTEGLALPPLDEEETEPFEPEHVNAIMRQLQSGTPRRMGTFVLATGARIAEVLGTLERSWKVESQMVEVRHVLKREGGRMVLRERGKTKNARRKLTTSAALAQIINEQVAHNATLPQASGQLFRTEAGTAWNPSNFRNRHWYPAVYAAYAKVMPPSERERWLAAVPNSLRLAAELLCVDEVTVEAVLDARWRDLDAERFEYRDADGNRQTAILPPALAAALSKTKAAAPASPPSLAPPSGRIFPHRKGQRIGRDWFIKTVFKEPFELIELRFDRRIHRARHTCVSLVSLDPAVSEKELQRRLGHGHQSSTNRYRHSFRADERQPADVLAQLTAGTKARDREQRMARAAALLELSPTELSTMLNRNGRAGVS
jgi:integrase